MADSLERRAIDRLQRRVLALVATLSSCAAPKEPAASTPTVDVAPLPSSKPAIAWTPVAPASVGARGSHAVVVPSAAPQLDDGPLAWRPVHVEAPVPPTLGKDETAAAPLPLCNADEARELACGAILGPLCTDPNAYLTQVEWTGFF